MERLLIATNNPGKVAELQRLLASAPFELVTPRSLRLTLDVEEDGDTYAANATKKARAFADASGLPALADDSGIEVDALNGGPGMYSARYGGPALDDPGRVTHLLAELQGVPSDRRTARFRALVALARPGQPEVVLAEGTVEGTIAFAPRGSNGFGYDPVFLLPCGLTMAEHPSDQKDAISHRGNAIRTLLANL